jgi:hypothetical protein
MPCLPVAARNHRSIALAVTCLLLWLVVPTTSHAQPYIRYIDVDMRDVFDQRSADWFFAGSLANAFHTQTRTFVLEDELLFTEGDELDDELLLETERNLRRTGLFSSVIVKVDTISDDSVDVIVFAQDRWSLRPAVLLGTGGGISNYGAKVEEVNLAGIGMNVHASALYSTENDIGWEGLLAFGQRRLFRSEVGLYASIEASKVRTEQMVSLVKPFRTLATAWAGQLDVWNRFGQDFFYGNRTPTPSGLPFEQRGVQGWWSTARGEVDRIFFSISAAADRTQRSVRGSEQLFDNTGRILISFSSISQKFKRDQFLNGYETEDVQTGGWGSVTLGRTFRLDRSGEAMWYVSARGEQSDYILPDVYLYGAVAGGSGFSMRGPRATGLEVTGLGHARLSQKVVLAATIRNQTSWNWDGFRQLILDNDGGLRGYAANALTGDNRFVSNVELRWFPQWKVWIFGLSGAVFHDMGSVWNQGIGLDKTRWHHSLGVGLRIHNLKASGGDAVYRIDLAYNMDERRFAGIVFTTNQLFSAFGLHRFRPAEIVNIAIDER